MSSLHHDRPLAEGTVPAGPVATPAPRDRRATGSSSAPVQGEAGSPVPTQRRGKAQTAEGRRVADSTTRTVGTAAARARAAAAKAVTVTAVTAEVVTARTATAKAATRKVAGAARTVAAATGAGRPVGGRIGGRHRAQPPATPTPTATAAVVVDAAVGTAAPAPRRPTPYKRGPVQLTGPEPGVVGTGLVEPRPAAAEPALVVVKDLPPAPVAPVPAVDVAGVPASADPEGVVAAVAQGRAGLRTRRPLSVRRGPAVHLAAALIGALGISGASAAPAEVQTRTVSHSVSVAEQLGIEATAPAVDEEEASSVLRGLVTSRNTRDAERTAAADAQAEANRLAAEEAARAAAEAARPKAVHPVEGARLTSGFGARWGTMHAGVDLAAPMRTPERAAMDGVVLEAGPAAGFGLAVYIQHDNGDVTVYGHMDEILVEPGQIVRAGDTIALLGNRGQSTGPHLHFEVHVGGLDGEKVDPLPWLRERGIHI